MTWLKVIGCVAAGYLLGCFSTGIVVSKAVAHIDIRTKGSGNPGTTNMLRTFGWAPSLLTFAGDILKAVLACWLGSLMLGEKGSYLAGVACVAGHNWPVFYSFKGGKGVASSFGVLLFNTPVIALSVLVLNLAIVAATKIMSIASIAAGLLNAVLSVILLRGKPFNMVCGLILSAMLLFCHRENIRRLIHSRENKLDFHHINEISRKK